MADSKSHDGLASLRSLLPHALEPYLRTAGAAPMHRLDHVRVLMYSHDTFGLGHLRRCRAIAHALVEHFKGLHVLIVSGSQIAGAFDFQARVDFVKIPSVIKLYNGEYTSIDSHIDIQETLQLRESIMLHTAQSFQPDIFIVDKEPLGLRGELERTLTFLKSRGCFLVLGLREVLDAPDLLAREWARKNLVRHIDLLYDRIWVYGPRDFWNPLTGLDVPASLLGRLQFTGFLRRHVPSGAGNGGQPAAAGMQPILITAGGGGDGASLMGQVLAAHEADPTLTMPTVMVLGPFMSADHRAEIHRRAAGRANISIVNFDNRLETRVQDAAGIVGMGGYNTFCEILSFDKRALIVPRVHPRKEQLIRAQRAMELGIVEMLQPEEADDPCLMAEALHRLTTRALPSQTSYLPTLDGLSAICDFVESYIRERNLPALRVVESGKSGFP
jgi:predicted glycosyltransferase